MYSCSTVPRVLLSISLSLFIASASADEVKVNAEKSNKTTTSVPSAKVIPESTLVAPAFLRTRLPESAIAYARVANTWGILGIPSGNTLDPAVTSKAFADAAKNIKEGFAENLLVEAPQGLRQLLQLLLQYSDSPLEAVALKNTQPSPLPASVLLSTAGNFDSADTLKELLVSIAEASPKVSLSKPLGDDGFAEVTVRNLAVQLHWDAKQSRLYLLVSPGSKKDDLVSALATLKPNATHPMLTTEQEIDESHKGSFVWIDPPELIQIAKIMGVPQSDLSVFSMMGVSAMNSAAIGLGTQNNINHLKLVVDMPMMGFRALMPSIQSSPTFNLNGETSYVATLGLPSKSHITNYQAMLAMGSPEAMEGYNQFVTGFRETTGFNVEDIFEFFGQDISIVGGETGTIFAVRLNNETAFNEMLEKLVKDNELMYEQREISGHTYHHLKLPSMSLGNQSLPDLGNGMDKLAKRILSAPTHLYWEKEDDYLLIANLPQVLMDRHNVEASIPADVWLKETQRVDPKGSLLMLSAVTNGVPVSIYRTQLSMLSYLGDLTEQPVDLFKLPTPKDVELPQKGAYGVKLTSTDKQLALDFSFEDNPLELIGGANYSSMMIAGMAAVVAASAQDQYETQQIIPKLTPGLTAAVQATTVLDEYKNQNGVYPDRAAIEELGLETGDDSYTLTVTETTGDITIMFNVGKYLGGSNQLTYEAPSSGSSTWTCQSNIRTKYLPESCY